MYMDFFLKKRAKVVYRSFSQGFIMSPFLESIIKINFKQNISIQNYIFKQSLFYQNLPKLKFQIVILFNNGYICFNIYKLLCIYCSNI